MKSSKIDSLLKEVGIAITHAKAKLAKCPGGSLHTRVYKGAFRYYSRTNADTCGKYLGKDSEKTIKALEEKAYYSQLAKTAAQEEKVLLQVKEKLEGLPDYNSVFLSIPRERRHLITPYEYSPKVEDVGIIRLFNKKPVNDEKKLITQNGEHVRSKSELIIADRLKAAGVEYYYEDPLIMADGKPHQGTMVGNLYWHPDFRVQSKSTGKRYYWEHFGMMDNPEYCGTSLKKMEIYAQYGYFPGENLIITAESTGHTLNLEYVDCLIERYLR